jgi:DNA-binding GntR family transcriptional regulator
MPVLAAHASLQRTSLRDQALTALRQAIVTGQIEPGVVY